MVLHMYYYNFQSNQTGIEISWVISSFTLSSGFQSNQTGIEIPEYLPPDIVVPKLPIEPNWNWNILICLLIYRSF